MENDSIIVPVNSLKITRAVYWTVTMVRCRFGLHGLSLIRVIVILVVVLILLQLLHMSMLSRLEVKGTATKQGRYLDQRLKLKTKVKNTWSRMERKLLNTHVLDHSGEYQVVENFIKPGESVDSDVISDVKERLQYFNIDTNGFDLSVVSQSSTSNLHHLAELSRVYQGPISVSVFTHSQDFIESLKAIAYLHLCDELVNQHVTFHLVYPLSQTYSNLSVPFSDDLCDQTLEHLSLEKHEKNYAYAVKYPHNLLRNVAIKYTTTSYVMVIDIDILPSNSLRNQFTIFIQDYIANSHKDTDFTAFVLPVFEIQDGSAVPETKADLLSSWQNGASRPFYSEVCWKCQRYTDYDHWKTYKGKDGQIAVSLYNSWQDPWEPFYIAKRNIPLYDERFKQYGFNRISQVCELHIAGYQFAILDNAFLMHRGFKSPDKFHRTKEREQNENRVLFRQLKEELKTKYPDSLKTC